MMNEVDVLRVLEAGCGTARESGNPAPLGQDSVSCLQARRRRIHAETKSRCQDLTGHAFSSRVRPDTSADD